MEPATDRQAAFLQRIEQRSFPFFRGEAAFSTWMYRVALNTALRFFERQYGVWLWLAAASVSLASGAVNTLVDNAGGRFRIDHPVTFVATVLGQILIVYGALRVAHQPFLAESRAILHDLEAQVLDETRALPERRVRGRRIRMAWIGVLLVFLLLGIAAALGLWWR